MRKVYLGLILAALFLIAACGQNETDGGPERVPVYEAEGGGQVSVPLPPHSQDYEPTGSETQLAEGPSVSVQPTLYPAPGTIVIVTEQALDQYVVAREIAHNHGADTVIHMSYTTPYWNNRAAYTAAMADAIIQDKAVRVLIINPSKDGDG
ncbi:MAG: hypothetical protein FWG38_04415, partial [Defluviitaleaceae bacterium]|nr:hypothetical protein [Defluviitaleaceae bacterium]